MKKSIASNVKQTLDLNNKNMFSANDYNPFDSRAIGLFSIFVFSLFLSIQSINAQISIEENGLVVMEVESAPLVGTWEKRTLISGYSGTSYYHAMTDYFNAGGNYILNYKFTITTAGIYQVQVRSRIAEGTTNTDFNDTWLRLVDSNGSSKTPVANSNTVTGTWYKYYQNVKNTWTWNTSNKDNDPKSLSWDLPAGTYSVQLSMRSKGHAVDRILLWNKSKYAFGDAQGKALNATNIDALATSKTDISNDIDNKHISNNIVYPNPATDKLFFNSADKLINKIELVNLTGKIVYAANVQVQNGIVYLKGIAKGMYLVKIHADNYIVTKKITVK